jgi:hypothetical protein
MMQLWEAAADGDTPGVRRLVAAGADVGSRDKLVRGFEGVRAQSTSQRTTHRMPSVFYRMAPHCSLSPRTGSLPFIGRL